MNGRGTAKMKEREEEGICGGEVVGGGGEGGGEGGKRSAGLLKIHLGDNLVITFKL